MSVCPCLCNAEPYTGPGGGDRLICHMPKKSWDRLVAVHFNCVSGKLWGMTSLAHGTYDEAAYVKDGIKVYPEW